MSPRRRGFAAGRRHLAGVAAGLALASAAALPAAAASPLADAYPARPVHVVVAASTGGGNDTLARAIADELEVQFEQPFVVENKPGGAGAVAVEAVAKAPPDGYTLLVIGPNLGSLRVQFPDIEGGRPLAPVTKLTSQPTVIVVHASLGVNTLSALVALAQRQPGRLAFATSGVGTSEHLAALMLQRQAGIELVHVPYSTIGARLRDIVTGEVPVVFGQFGSLARSIRSGSLVPLAVASRRRSILFPDVPTTADAGYPGVEVQSWSGLFAPAGTPPAVIDRLQASISAILLRPAVRERLAAQGLEPDGSAAPVLAEDIQRGNAIRLQLLRDGAAK